MDDQALNARGSSSTYTGVPRPRQTHAEQPRPGRSGRGGHRRIKATGRDELRTAVSQAVAQTHHGGLPVGDLLGEYPGAVQQQVDGVAYVLGEDLLRLDPSGGPRRQHTGGHPLHNVPTYPAYAMPSSSAAHAAPTAPHES